MGQRRTILVNIKTQIHGLTVTGGGSKTISAINTYFDPEDEITQLTAGPRFSVVPMPENIVIGLYGETKDRTLPISILGYALTINETLFLDGEDIIETIIAALTNNTNAQANIAAGFSVVSIGPVISEQSDFRSEFVYISIPIVTQFLET